MNIYSGDKLPLNPIPADDIMDAYCGSSTELRQAVTNLLRARNYLVASVTEDPEVSERKTLLIDWATNPEASLLIVTSLIEVGKQRFGDVWKTAVLEMVSQTE